jgi:hypothetical protein
VSIGYSNLKKPFCFGSVSSSLHPEKIKLRSIKQQVIFKKFIIFGNSLIFLKKTVIPAKAGIYHWFLRLLPSQE